ncbi:hypothetical protein [Psychrobacter sp. Sarcosine-3u-12]|uniref:hypothetical protein n=1 Tax=Psychrobacter sp. Sarcosine-3u-12 TaxID=2058325 RepID=UPI000C32E245|nr:hypothetical protein [Psychrobacter sp. Sarcosine-3u-12]PKG36492.1 hypothetical protein CXF65_02225 [Psychrobacter sp. Sarcosine-3u-12]
MKILLFLFCILSSSHLAMARDYCNGRFAYCVDVPNQLQWLPEADNGDGRHFKLPNSNADILVFGSNTPSVFFYTDSDYLKEKQHRYKTGMTVTYERLKDKTYTVSGYREDGQVFYHVIKVNNGQEVVLHLNYPESEKTKMTSIVKQMARSFKLH